MGLSGWNSLLLVSIPDLKCFDLFHSFTRISVGFREATEINKFIQFVVFTGSSPSYSTQLLFILCDSIRQDLLWEARLKVLWLDKDSFLCSPTGSFSCLYCSPDQTVLKLSISIPDSPCRLGASGSWGRVLVISISKAQGLVHSGIE